MTSWSGPLSVFAAGRDAPHADALITPTEQLSWCALAARVVAVAGALSALGVTAGTRVALRAGNQTETVVALLALAEIGATAVLVHPRWTDSEAAVAIAVASPSFVFDDEGLRGLGDRAFDPPAPVSLEHESPLAMVFTSGTTGRPKAALLPRRAFVASALSSAANLGWNTDDRWLLTLPLCHVGGFSVLTRCLIARKTVVLLPRFDPELSLDAIVRHRTTLLSVVPTMLRAMLDRDQGRSLARPRAVLVGGAAFPRAMREESFDAGVRALATYGLTEACSQVATERLDPAGRPYAATDGVGRPLAGVSLRVVGSRGEGCAPGVVGHIELRGPCMMLGYEGAPPLGDRWFDTGDLGALDQDGALSLRGRGGDLVVTGGENVYPAEVEAALLAGSEVHAALVFGVSDPTWGQRVSAGLVLADGASEGTLARVRERLRRTLAGYKIPSRVCVVAELPLLPTGKPDRARCETLLGPSLRAWT